MSIIQISKIQHRTGNIADLPQLDIGELGWATDERRLFIGNDPLITPAPPAPQPNNTEILTSISALAGGSNTQVQYNNEGDLAGSTKFTFDQNTGNVVLGGNFLPQSNVIYDLGSSTLRWKDLYLDGSTIYIGGGTITGYDANTLIQVVNLRVTQDLTVQGNATVTGNISGNNITANGDLTVSGGDIVSTTTTSNILNTTSTTVNFAGAATTIEIGSVTGNTNINNNLIVDGNTRISGNLTVDGNFSYVNVESMKVEDPIIELGGGANGATLTSDDNKDRGLIYHYHTGTSAIDGFFGWDDSNSEFALGSNVTVSNEVVSFNTFGNLRLNAINGSSINVSSLTATTGNIPTFTSNLSTITTIESTTGNIVNLNSTTGTFTGNVSANNIAITNNISAGSMNVTTLNIGSAEISGDLTLNTLTVTTSVVSPFGNIVILAAETFDATDGTFTGNLSTANLTVTGTATLGTSLSVQDLTVFNTITGNVYTGTSLTLSEDIFANNITTYSTLTSPTINFTNLSGATGTFTGDITSNGNISADFDVSGATGSFSTSVNTQDVIAGNLVSAPVGNIIIINSTDGNFAGNVIGSYIEGTNINATSFLSTAALFSSGNIDTTGNINGADIYGANISAVNLNVSSEVIGSIISANTDMFSPNITLTGFVNAQTANISGSLQGGNILENKSGRLWPVITQEDIGIDAHKIPLNQFLGPLAYQNIEDVTILHLTVTTLDISSNVTIASDLAVNGGDITTTATTANIVNANATTINFAGAATAIEIGAGTGNTNINNNLVVDGDIAVNGGDITTTSTSAGIFVTTVNTLNVGNAAENISIGATTGTTLINNKVSISKEIAFSKTITAGGTTGDITANTISGTANFAAAATSLTVTNSLVTANSIIIATVATNDSTMKSVQVVAGTGTFVIYADNAATAETRVNWIVIN